MLIDRINTLSDVSKRSSLMTQTATSPKKLRFYFLLRSPENGYDKNYQAL